MNDPLCLENSSGNLGRVSPVFNIENVQEQIGKHVSSERIDLKLFFVYGRYLECLLAMDLFTKRQGHQKTQC